jgi:hypothetical protein
MELNSDYHHLHQSLHFDFVEGPESGITKTDYNPWVIAFTID